MLPRVQLVLLPRLAPKKADGSAAASAAAKDPSVREQTDTKEKPVVIPKSVKPIRGRCKSGRIWKKPSLKRTNVRSMRVDPQKSGKSAKLTPFELRKRRKRAERAAKEQKARRRADAEWRNGKIQVITNGNKIKKMSKRQLRQLRKVSVDADGTRRLVNPWTGEAYD